MELDNVFRSHDILLFCETWGNELYDYGKKGFKHITLHRTSKHKRARRDSGGLIVYIADRLYHDDCFVKHVSDCLIMIQLKGLDVGLVNDLYLCLCYNIPTGSSRENVVDQNIFDMLTEEIIFLEETFGEANIIVLGDLNARVGDKCDYIVDNFNNIDILAETFSADIPLKRNTQDCGVNEHGTELLNFCKATGFRIMNGRVCEDGNVGKYTCIKSAGSSVVDYVLCKPDLMECFAKFNVCEPNILSDHCAISFSIHNHMPIEQAERQNYDHISNKKSSKYVWNPDKDREYLDALKSEENTRILNTLIEQIEHISSEDTINENINGFYEFMSNITNPLFKRDQTNKPKNKTPNTHKSEWFDIQCQEQRNSFYKNLRTYEKINSDEYRQNMTKSRSEYKTIIRQKRNLFNRKETEKLEKMRSKNAKEYWKMLKNTSHRVENNNIQSEDFYKYFKAINNPSSPFFQPDEDTIHFNNRYLNGELQVMFSELDIEITQTEILKACKELHNNRAAGPDMLINEFFKYGANELIYYLHALFNKLFNIEHFPDKWCQGFIIPLHKTGSLNDLENYRGISLLSHFGKIFTRVLSNRLNTWAETYNVYVEAQAGFRKDMSTIDNIFVLNAIVSHMLNANKKLYVALVDFSKAYDLVVRDVLWSKLIKYGVRGKILNIIKCMYNAFKTAVRVNGEVTESYMNTCGVAQGECLSSFLFSIYFNDLEETLELGGFEGIEIDMLKLFVLLYADDIILFAESGDKLQNGLNLLQDYCTKSKLTVNITKSKIMIFKRGRASSNERFMYKNEALEIVSTYKYLGIVISSGGSYKHTCDTLASQSLKALFKLKKHLNKFVDLQVSHRMELFDKLILPILNYGSEIWGNIEAMQIERIHLKFCKEILGVKHKTQNNFIYGELGRMPLRQHRIVAMIRYWLKITTSNDTKFAKHAYNILLQDMEIFPNKANWAGVIKHILDTNGFSDVWIYQGVSRVNIFMNIFKQRLKDSYKQEWLGHITDSSRAYTYKHFCSFNFKTYLDDITITKFRVALTQLRLSSHRLRIETGRWNKPVSTPFHERICIICSKLEDEYHFLLECPAYNTLRSQYIKQYYYKHPNMVKFIELLKSENSNEIKNLASYIYKAFELRKVML